MRFFCFYKLKIMLFQVLPFESKHPALKQLGWLGGDWRETGIWGPRIWGRGGLYISLSLSLSLHLPPLIGIINLTLRWPEYMCCGKASWLWNLWECHHLVKQSGGGVTKGSVIGRASKYGTILGEVNIEQRIKPARDKNFNWLFPSQVTTTASIWTLKERATSQKALI